MGDYIPQFDFECSATEWQQNEEPQCGDVTLQSNVYFPPNHERISTDMYSNQYSMNNTSQYQTQGQFCSPSYNAPVICPTPMYPAGVYLSPCESSVSDSQYQPNASTQSHELTTPTAEDTMKALYKDPEFLPVAFTPDELDCSTQSDQKSPKKRRKPTPTAEADRNEAYWCRRKKNNESAKRSRDAKRAKLSSNEQRVQDLELKNMKVQAQIDAEYRELLAMRKQLSSEGRANVQAQIDKLNMERRAAHYNYNSATGS